MSFSVELLMKLPQSKLLQIGLNQLVI